MIGMVSFVGYLLVCTAGAALAWTHTAGDVDEFAKLFTPFVAAVSSLLAALVAYININRQMKLTKQVEQLKADLTIGIEATKAALSAASTAYTELSRAMYSFYHSIVKIDEKAFNAAISKAADEEIQKVIHHLDRLDITCREPYGRAWQELHVVRERCTVSASATDCVECWSAARPRISQALSEFERNYKANPIPRA